MPGAGVFVAQPNGVSGTLDPVRGTLEHEFVSPGHVRGALEHVRGIAGHDNVFPGYGRSALEGVNLPAGHVLPAPKHVDEPGELLPRLSRFPSP